jgi:hypothetical protein
MIKSILGLELPSYTPIAESVFKKIAAASPFENGLDNTDTPN